MLGHVEQIDITFTTSACSYFTSNMDAYPSRDDPLFLIYPLRA